MIMRYRLMKRAYFPFGKYGGEMLLSEVPVRQCEYFRGCTIDTIVEPDTCWVRCSWDEYNKWSGKEAYEKSRNKEEPIFFVEPADASWL